jgi:hypothetical protein
MKYYTIQNTFGTSPGPYSVYYNTVDDGSLGSLVTLYPSHFIATGITMNQLNLGLDIEVPNNAVVIYVYNNYCEDYQKLNLVIEGQELRFSVGEENNGTCFCLTINNLETKESNTVSVCQNGNMVNDKPVYTNESVDVTWNNNGYWEMNEYSSDGVVFRSTDSRDIPLSNWFGVGVKSNSFEIISQEGNCNTSSFNNVLLMLDNHNPSCVGINDGTITAYVIGGTGFTGSWSYSIDGYIFTNTTGIFNNLNSGLYTIYAKYPVNDFIISKSVELQSTPISYFSIPGNLTINELQSVGNMKYYLASVTYDTSLIPLGETITFDYSMNYSLNYLQPGSVDFDTTQHTIYKNGGGLNILENSLGTFTQISPSTCNQAYYLYSKNNTYSSNSVSLINGDTLVVNAIYGIDTKTNGGVDGTCYTKGWVDINLSFENIQTSCQCCQLNRNLVNVTQQPQIYQV